ncbi:MAG: non-canonical purine NTP pyrophosphatase, partial [Euryarchaeota archaeon]|nr:non-canonical purine NTP pyrophosphatase [Euryarchaeota archaeon]
FKTVVAFSESVNTEPRLFVGTTDGKITEKRRGAEGFGYDPIFEVEGKTFAERSTEEKNRLSHRGKAFRKLLDYLV